MQMAASFLNFFISNFDAVIIISWYVFSAVHGILKKFSHTSQLFQFSPVPFFFFF